MEDTMEKREILIVHVWQIVRKLKEDLYKLDKYYKEFSHIIQTNIDNLNNAEYDLERSLVSNLGFVDFDE